MVQRRKIWEVGKKGEGVNGGVRNNYGGLVVGGGLSFFWGGTGKEGTG